MVDYNARLGDPGLISPEVLIAEIGQEWKEGVTQDDRHDYSTAVFLVLMYE